MDPNQPLPPWQFAPIPLAGQDDGEGEATGQAPETTPIRYLDNVTQEKLGMWYKRPTTATITTDSVAGYSNVISDGKFIYAIDGDNDRLVKWNGTTFDDITGAPIPKRGVHRFEGLDNEYWAGNVHAFGYSQYDGVQLVWNYSTGVVRSNTTGADLYTLTPVTAANVIQPLVGTASSVPGLVMYKSAGNVHKGVWTLQALAYDGVNYANKDRFLLTHYDTNAVRYWHLKSDLGTANDVIQAFDADWSSADRILIGYTVKDSVTNDYFARMATFSVSATSAGTVTQVDDADSWQALSATSPDELSPCVATCWSDGYAHMAFTH